MPDCLLLHVLMWTLCMSVMSLIVGHIARAIVLFASDSFPGVINEYRKKTDRNLLPEGRRRKRKSASRYTNSVFLSSVSFQVIVLLKNRSWLAECSLHLNVISQVLQAPCSIKYTVLGIITVIYWKKTLTAAFPMGPLCVSMQRTCIICFFCVVLGSADVCIFLAFHFSYQTHPLSVSLERLKHWGFYKSPQSKRKKNWKETNLQSLHAPAGKQGCPHKAFTLKKNFKHRYVQKCASTCDLTWKLKSGRCEILCFVLFLPYVMLQPSQTRGTSWLSCYEQLR